MISGGGGGGKGGGGRGGGGSGPVRASSRKADPYKQSLRSNSVAEVVDILCEGPILGLVAEIDEGADYRGKSIAFDDTPLMSANGSENFTGCSVRLRTGTANQNPIKTNYGISTAISFDPPLELTEVGVTREINLPDADSLKILLYAPAFYGQKKKDGSFYDASVQFSILVNGWQAYHTGFSGQTTGAYQRQYELSNLQQFGSNPWTIQIVLDEGYYHSNQTYLKDRIYWTGVVGVTGEQFSWPYVAHTSIRVGAKQFGGNVPSRAYEIYGYAKCPMPNVYDPNSTDENRFSGSWDGETWRYEWTDNPAWCWLTMLTNERFGLGIPIEDLGVLKWQLCKIARYCDEFVPLAGGGSERRWTFNAVIQTQEEAFHVLNSLASAFVATPLWASNEVLMMQDAPDDSEFPEDVNYSHIANQTNVIDGAFNYSGTAINAKHTVARVTWNDPDDFGRPTVAYYENAEGIKRYGWRPKDVVAEGCTSYSQAIRYGRWVIETELSEGDLVTFIGDMSFGDCTPGNRIAVMDPCFADIRFGGRVTYAQTADGYTYITVDDAITLAAGTTYTLHLCIPLPTDEKPAERQEQVVQVISAEILTGASTTNYLKIAEQAVLPAIGSYWYVSEPNLNPRYFTCLANEPQPGQQHKITALYHDYSKFGRIYGEVEAAPLAPESYVPTGVIPAPADLDATEYAYESGNNWRPGVLLAWSHINDARVVYYQIDRKRLDADEAELAWRFVGETQECSFNVQPCRAGNWAFRVRGMGTLNGEWGEIESFTVIGKTEDPPNVSNLTVKGGGTSFSTRALKLVWDTVIGEDYMPSARFLHYKVSLCDSDGDALLTKTVSSEYCQFSLSELANTYASPLSAFKVSCIAVDICRQESPTPTVVTITPATPPTVTAVTVKGGGTTFTDRDCNLEWTEMVNNGISESRFWRYKVQIKTTGDEVKWTKYTTDNSLTFTRSQNLKAFGTLTREFKVGVAVVDTYRKVGTEQVATVSNPAPDMSAFTPTIKELTTGIRIDWSGWDDSAIPDLKQFRIYCDTDNPPTTLVAKLAAHRDRYKFDDGIKSYASHYVQIVPYDEFGEGVASAVAASSGQDIDIDKPIELSTDGKIIAGTPAGARVEYSAAALTGYSDETTKEFEISSTDGKIKAGAGAVTLDLTGITINQGIEKVNRIGWTSGASKVAGTDGYEYTCILSHIASSDNKPGEEGNNWPTYWQKENRLGVGYWQPLDYYHAAETDNISMLYGVDDPSNYRAYTTLHTRGDNIGASAETRVRARCASGKKAQVLLYANDASVDLTDNNGTIGFNINNLDLNFVGGGNLHLNRNSVGHGVVYATRGICVGSSKVDPGAIGNITLEGQLISKKQSGKAIIVDEGATGVCTNLNADMVDSCHVGGAGGLATLDANSKVAFSIIQNVSATDKLLGRSSAGAGTIEEITCTAAGRALLDDATSAAQCTTLGLGTTDSPAFAGVTVSPSSRPVTISSGDVSMKCSAGGWAIGTRFLDSNSEAVGSFSAYGWDDDLVRYYIGTFESAELLSVTAAGLVGIGVINPTYNLEIACGDARNIGVQRQTKSNTGGNNLLLTAGSATVAAENKNGGSLRLRPGLCTGSGYGQVQIYGCLGPGSGSSTTDGTYQELLTCRENKIGFFGGTPAVQQVLAAYTSDAESSAYTTTGSGADIASKADLNALRTAYETLRAMCEDLRTKLLATTLLTS